ncbi:carbohydrate ABC transporter permease [Ruminococcaceae bacterium OttesenSCG-928-L11]|nr:carbohydrate ABC transporter permease [Ruminococcaceae bacterium OttesenSCG-928-L11]
MNRNQKLSPSDKAFYIVDFVFLLVSGVVVLLPLLNVLAMSLSSPNAVLAGRVYLWPKNFTLDTYLMVLRTPTIKTGYLNTFFYMIVGTCINLFMTVCCAYPLSRRDLVGKNTITMLFTFTMAFSGGMIPTYIVIKNLNLLDSRWVMLLPPAMTVWNMILARTFFQNTIPFELYESAELDGASDIRVLLSIVLPLSTPILAVLTLFYAVSTHWNAYFNAMMYLKSQSLFNIQLVLRNTMNNISIMMNQMNDLTQQERSLALAEASKYCIIMLSMLPVMLIYPFVQKYFIKGIMIGSVKG